MAGLAPLLDIDGRPAPAELMKSFRSLDVDMSVDAGSTFSLVVGITQSARDWTVLERDLFKPLTKVAIRLEVGSDSPVLVLNGYVSNQRVVYADEPGSSALQVDGMDASLLMNLEERVKAWQDQSDSKIATEIFGRHKLDTDVTTTSPVLSDPEGTTIQRGSDIRFLRRLARRNGFECYVRPGTPRDVGVFAPPRLTGRPQAVLSVALGDKTNVNDFSIRYEMAAPTTAESSALDVPKKAVEQGNATAASLRALGKSSSLDGLKTKPVVLASETALIHGSDLKRNAQAIVDRSTWVVVAEGEVGQDVGVLQLGGIANARGISDMFNGSYYVTRVHHRVDGRGYRQRFEARRNALGATGSEVYR